MNFDRREAFCRIFALPRDFRQLDKSDRSVGIRRNNKATKIVARFTFSNELGPRNDPHRPRFKTAAKIEVRRFGLRF